MDSESETGHLELRQMPFGNLQGCMSKFTYTSPFYYNLIITANSRDTGWSIELKKTAFDIPFEKSQEESIANDYKANAQFYFAYLKDTLKKIGWICVEHISWNNTSRLWDIDVDVDFRHQGYGTELMGFIKKICAKSGSRALVLECQSSNYPAIQFYRKMGFQLGGFDSIAYSNQDIHKHEVRLEMVYILD